MSELEKQLQQIFNDHSIYDGVGDIVLERGTVDSAIKAIAHLTAQAEEKGRREALKERDKK